MRSVHAFEVRCTCFVVVSFCYIITLIKEERCRGCKKWKLQGMRLGQSDSLIKQQSQFQRSRGRESDRSQFPRPWKTIYSSVPFLNSFLSFTFFFNLSIFFLYFFLLFPISISLFLFSLFCLPFACCSMRAPSFSFPVSCLFCSIFVHFQTLLWIVCLQNRKERESERERKRENILPLVNSVISDAQWTWPSVFYKNHSEKVEMLNKRTDEEDYVSERERVRERERAKQLCDVFWLLGVTCWVRKTDVSVTIVGVTRLHKLCLCVSEWDKQKR